VVIFKKDVGEEYKSIMRSIGVPINDSKSMISSPDTIRAEFAKRIFLNGQEISPINFKLIKQCSMSLYMFPELFRVMQLRGWLESQSEFRPPSYLTDKGKKLVFLLSLSPSGQFICPFVKGWYKADLDLDSINRKFLEIRRDKLVEKIGKIWVQMQDNQSWFDSCLPQAEPLSAEILASQRLSSAHPLHFILKSLLDDM
jgi:hypothetical protein